MIPFFEEKVYKENGKVPVTTTEGKAAVNEAIKYLEGAVPAKKLRRLQTLE